jgi:anti-anti-sigma factor
VPTSAFHSEPQPPPADFSVTVDEARGHVRVCVVGELDACTAPSLVEAVTGLASQAAIPAQRPRDVQLDLSRLTFLDTAGLTALADSRLVLRAAGWRFHVVRAQPNVGRLLAYAITAGWLPQDLLDRAPASA